jgi:hypothetical protein
MGFAEVNPEIEGAFDGGSNWRIPCPFFVDSNLALAKIRINDQRCRWTPVEPDRPIGDRTLVRSGGHISVAS